MKPDNNDIFTTKTFADSLKGKKNCRGGIFRAGTGSAMFYLWHANDIGASPDGRRKGEPFGTNFSASLFAKIDGPVSVIKSFTKPELSDVINEVNRRTILSREINDAVARISVLTQMISE